MKKLFIPVVIVLIVSLVLAACSSQTAAPSASAAATPSIVPLVQTLDIGEIESISGVFSDFMKYAPQGARQAADLVNSRGGITVNGQKYLLNLILEDNASTPIGSQSAANDLILNKHVGFIVGTGPTPLVIAIDKVTEPAGVLYTSIYQNGTPDEMGPNYPLKFVGSNCSFSAQLTAMTYFTQIYPVAKTIAFIQSDDGQIKYDDPVVRANAASLGLTIQGDTIGIGVDPIILDYAPYANAAISRNSDAIMIGNAPTSEISKLLQNLRAQGYAKPIFSGSYPVVKDVVGFAGNSAAEGFFANSLPADPNIPGLPAITRQIVQTSISTYGTFDSLHLQGFNAVYTLAQAIQNAQSLDPKVVADAWGKMTTIDTIFGPGKMGGLKTYGINHNVYFQTPITVVKNGQLQFGGWIPLNQSALP